MSDIILSKEIYEEIKIKDHTGKVLSQFSFNPSDANIIERYDRFVEGFDELSKEIMEYERKDNKDAEDSKKMLHSINEKINSSVDYLLNAEVSGNIFSVMGALSPLPSGDYYLTFIIDQIGKKIENATGARMKQIDMKVKKYTSKYHK